MFLTCELDSKSEVDVFSTGFCRIPFRLRSLFQVWAEVEALKQISKLNSVKRCHELKDYGVNLSKHYDVDPDGELSGQWTSTPG